MTDPVTTKPPAADNSATDETAAPVDGVTAPPTPLPEAPGGKERRKREVGWRSRDVLRAAALVAAVFIALRLLWFANQLVLVAFIGLLFGLAISAGVDRLERFRIPRGLGAAIVVLTFFALLYAIGALMAPTIAEQSNELKSKLPEAINRVEGWLQGRNQGLFSTLLGGESGPTQPQGTTGQAPPTQGGTITPSDTIPHAPTTPLEQGIRKQLSGAVRYLFPFVTSTLAVLAGLLVILFVAIYVATEPDLYHRGLMHLFPHRTRHLAGEVLSQIATSLRRWLITQLIAMLVIGTVTTIVLLLLDVKAPYALGVIAGFLEFIPTIGPILSAVPAVAMGFLDSPEKALYVVIAYIAIQQVEGHLLIPLLMKGGVDLPPVLTILSQALMALLFGFLGLMVAVPMLAAVMVPIKMLYVERVVGDDVGISEGES
jgi:predicted PurR-regulated permease PerM